MQIGGFVFAKPHKQQERGGDMKKILFLSSALIMTVCSAFAEDVATTDKKITGGAGTCTVDILGVSADGATANTIATWSLNSYECAAGQYLDETTLNCTECPVGSYCPGGTFTVEANNSKNACPADYTSDAAATAESECYMGCELACSVNAECPPHSKNCVHSAFTTTGRQYVDTTCNAYPSVCPIADFGCDIGYHKSTMNLYEIMPKFGPTAENVILDCTIGGFDLTNGKNLPENDINDCEIIPAGTSLLQVDNYVITAESTINTYGPDTPGVIFQEYQGMANMTDHFIYLPDANFTPGIHADKESAILWVTISKIGIPTIATRVLTDAFSEFQSTGSLSNDTLNALQTNLPQDAWLQLQTLLEQIQSGTNSSEAQMTEFMSVYIKTLEQISTNMPWANPDEASGELALAVGIGAPISTILSMVAFFDMDDADGDTLLQYIDAEVPYCANNIINIDWNPDNGDASTQNMCIYDGPVTLPSDPVRPGYTFMGWKLVE